MTYTITITEPGAEPVNVSPIIFTEVSQAIDGAMHHLPVTNGAALLEIMSICAKFLNAAGIIKSISLEWTTDAPTVAGWYQVERTDNKQIEMVRMKNSSYVHAQNGEMWVYVGGNLYQKDEYTAMFTRWLGPIPLVTGGE